jgi:hypothetical protein
MNSAVLEDLPAMKAQGLKHLCIERPIAEQAVFDKFVKEGLSEDWLSREIFGAVRAELPEAFAQKIQIFAWARDNGVALWAVDAGPQIWRAIGSVTREAASRALPVLLFEDPNAIEAAKRYGQMPNDRHLSDDELVTTFWRHWMHGRSKEMAVHIAEIATAHPGERVVAILGNGHVSLAPFHRVFARSGVNLAGVPLDGVKELLPADVAARTQAVQLLGGSRDVARMTDLEAMIVARGLGASVVAIGKLSGVRAVDSAIYFPSEAAVTTTTVASVMRNDRRQ